MTTEAEPSSQRRTKSVGNTAPIRRGLHIAASPVGAAHRLRADRPGAAPLRVRRLEGGEYPEKDISPYFWHNGRYPGSDEYQRRFDGGFAEYRLHVGGLVEHPVDLSLADLRVMPYHEQITRHFCIQGWSGVAKWGGVSMQAMLDLVQPRTEAKWVVFYSLGDGADSGKYYDAHPLEQMHYRLTMLAYDMNGEPLSFGHRTPLRLRNETQLGVRAGEVDRWNRVRHRPFRHRWGLTVATTRTTSSSATASRSEWHTASQVTAPLHARSGATSSAAAGLRDDGIVRRTAWSWTRV
jgi:hypothetical protein